MPNKKQTFNILGLMSGTSLDGLDIALCEFKKTKSGWSHKIIKAETLPYDVEQRMHLSDLMNESAVELAATDAEFGTWCGAMAAHFLKENKLSADLIASHGHTVFHQPDRGFTLQIGNGAYIAASSGLPVVSDFRTMDVGLGGQGAPLVPVGDMYLFEEYEFCLNIGGIANISFSDKKGTRLAYDICPVNIVLNKIAGEFGKEYDEDGQIALSGQINKDLLKELNDLSFYKQPFPKSLGREWIDQYVFPMINVHNIPTEDKMATLTEHMAIQIAQNALKVKKTNSKMLVTGGGAFNKYLIDRIKFHCKKNIDVVLPDKNTILFKEALVFAFLGLLKVENQVNILKSVTGASQDHIGGALYGSFIK